MSGPLCEALDLPGSAAALAELARSNLLLVPLDRRGHWYRYHHLFRDMLLAELERLEPGMLAVLRRRAAAWCLANDLAEEALEYAIAAEDVEMVARLVQTLWRRFYGQGRTATLQRWFRWLEDRGGIEGRPLVAMNAAFLAEMTGHPARAERWADAVDRWQYQDASASFDAYTEAMAATLRAILCRRGPEQMRAARRGSAPGGAPGPHQRPAAAALADLCGAPLGRPAPDRAHPRSPRAERPGRGQDAHAGDRRDPQSAAGPGHRGRGGRGAAGPAVPAARGRQSRGVGADRGRTAHPAAAGHPPDRPARRGGRRARHADRRRGRKFGLYLLVSTQRPQKIPENVLSQADNLVLLRLNSLADSAFAEAAFSFVPPSLIDRSVTFRQGEGLIAGKISPHPALLRFDARITEEGGADVPATWASAR